LSKYCQKRGLTAPEAERAFSDLCAGSFWCVSNGE
jgi:hypothetical protein